MGDGKGLRHCLIIVVTVREHLYGVRYGVLLGHQLSDGGLGREPHHWLSDAASTGLLPDPVKCAGISGAMILVRKVRTCMLITLTSSSAPVLVSFLFLRVFLSRLSFCPTSVHKVVSGNSDLSRFSRFGALLTMLPYSGVRIYKSSAGKGTYLAMSDGF